MPDLLNVSINSTLSRSIITHVTVTLALLALLFFGGHAIHGFVATMMFGVVLVGTYTSVFIAAPILIYLGVGTGAADETGAEAAEARSVHQARATSRAPAGLSLAEPTPHLPQPARDRGLWQWRLPLRRHVASRLDAVPAGWHLGLAGDAPRRSTRQRWRRCWRATSIGLVPDRHRQASRGMPERCAGAFAMRASAST